MTCNRICVLAAPIAILILFGSTLVGIDRLAFRDVSHFYTPLYGYVAERTEDAWIPLWNPLDATGLPLLGETTTAVLYPPRYLIFTLPVSTEVAMAIYVSIHLVFASMMASLAARWSGASRSASRLAGVIYPLSGSVLFLHCNPPFLVGAAWLPLAVAALTTRRPLPKSHRALVAGAALASMVIGGDPQTALHAVLVALALWLARKMAGSHDQISLSAIASAGVLAAILAAPQLAASIAWSGQSDRVRYDDPDWLGPPASSSRRADAYQFSVPPWHVAELVTPNASGSPMPINRRLSRLMPGDGRMWTPTIYMGLVTVLLLATVFFQIAQDTVGTGAWFWIAAVGLALSFGHFGLVWLIQQFSGTFCNMDSAIGGPYWLIYHFVPGYDAFRYPAKWLPVFALSVSIAVSIAADNVPLDVSGVSIRRAAVLVGMLLVAAISVLVWQHFSGRIVASDGDEYWGPLDRQGAVREIGQSLIHSFLALSVICMVFRRAVTQDWGRSRLIHAMVLLVAVDLYVTGSRLVMKVNRRDEASLIEHCESAHRVSSGTRWMRTQSGRGWPAYWRSHHSANRMEEVAASERLARFGRWHLAERTHLLNGMVSIRNRHIKDFWDASRAVTSQMGSDEREAYWKSVRRWLAIDGVLHASDLSIDVSSQSTVHKIVDVRRSSEPRLTNPLVFRTVYECSDAPRTLQRFTDFLRHVHATAGEPRSIIHGGRRDFGFARSWREGSAG